MDQETVAGKTGVGVTDCSQLHATHSVIYQFIPNAPVRVMERLIRSMVPGTMAILDLENGYLDVRDPARTSERREGLV